MSIVGWIESSLPPPREGGAEYLLRYEVQEGVNDPFLLGLSQLVDAVA